MAGDPFLSDPSRKRKRSSKTSTVKRTRAQERTNERATNNEDSDLEDLSSSTEEHDAPDAHNEEELSLDEEFANENAADKRRRLAKQYLENLKQEEAEDDFFDAQDLDNDIIARRLQVDVAENKGQIYKHFGERIAQQMDSVAATATRVGSKNLTSMAVKYPHLYTVSKDIELIKWDISGKKARRIRHIKNSHHTDEILCVAASPDGKYVVTGGRDGRLIIWSTESLACLKVLDTRGAVNAIAFRRNTDQLYAACADLRIRTFLINQFTQLEILYGHQDNISDISALLRETCVSVGSRDKTAMFWKIADESRLTFRGGDSVDKKKKGEENDSKTEQAHEGLIDVVTMVDESKFITGSDNGKVSLWSLSKKKPVCTQRLAHGLQPQFTPNQASAEEDSSVASQQIPPPQPYWITAVHAVPFSDVFVTGSFDGTVRVWRIGEKMRDFQEIGQIPNVRGVVTRIESAEVDKKVVVFVMTSKEHKLGRWLNVGGRNAVTRFEVNV